MNWKKRLSGVDATLFLLVFLSALLMASGVIVIQRLTGALDQIVEIAQPPHYLQMHIGEIDHEAVQQFSNATGLVEQMEIQDMVNVEGVNIEIHRQTGTFDSLSDSLLDNYFVKQNERFDYLLDLENQRVGLNAGEIGVPVGYAKEKNITLGDTLKVQVGTERLNFKVTYVIRDAQMGSSLASSIRFLVSASDFDVLDAQAIRKESILAFRLLDEARISDFQALYQSEASGMPSNGVGITLPLIIMLNGIGDGLLSGVLILVSGALIAIAIFNIRFAILSTLENEAQAIGTLKAIGLNQKDVQNLYKVKYRVLTMSACLVAVFCAFGTSKVLLNNISLNFGLANTTLWTFVLPFIAVLGVYVIVMLSVQKILKRISKMSIIEALVSGKKPSRFKLFFNHCDASLSLHDLRFELKSWLTYGLLFFLIALTILVPLNMYMTLTSPEFVKYVGAAKSDLRITIEYRPEYTGLISDIERGLSEASQVKDYHAFQTLKGELMAESGNITFVAEAGDYSVFPVEMQSGNLPVLEGEIALSALNQKRLDVVLGEHLTIDFDGEPKLFTVVGVYQDITNGGITAKVSKSVTGQMTQAAFFINLKEKEPLDVFVESWSETYPEAKVLAVDKLIDQTLGTITHGLLMGVVSVFVLSILVAGLIAFLFMTLKRHRNASRDSELLTIGFTKQSIRRMYLYQCFVVSFLGILLGALASYYWGGVLMTLVLVLLNFGLTQMQFIISPFYFITFGCLIPLVVGLLFTWLVTGKIQRRMEG